MGQSVRIRSQELHAIYRLVGECRELGDDPAVWNLRLCQGFHDLVRADVVASVAFTGYFKGSLGTVGFADWGWEASFDRDAWLEAHGDLRDVERRSEPFRALRESLRRGGAAAFTCHRLLPGGAWGRSYDGVIIRDVAGLQESLYAGHPTGDARQYSILQAYRAKGCRPFGEREQGIARIMHAAVAPLIGGALASFADPAPSDLPPRARQVLRLLLEGEGDKQIAAALRISPHTVNQYVKTIFGHFRVSSRTELLARWVRRGWSSRAAWCPELNGSP